MPPSNGDIDTIEVIDEWALIYVDEEEDTKPRNTIGASTTLNNWADQPLQKEDTVKEITV